MRAVVVYESMFGNTRQVAEAIADGLACSLIVETVPVIDATRSVCQGADLVVVGGPTHAWGMSWPSTRRGAPLRLRNADSGLALEPGADRGIGVREWLSSFDWTATKAAAFDTRIASPVLFTGHASKAIGRRLVRQGLSMIAPPESFLVDKGSHLMAGELERAQAWGASLAQQVSDSPRTSPTRVGARAPDRTRRRV